MWRFYWGVLKDTPRLLWNALEGLRKVVAVIVFLALLGNQEALRLAAVEWWHGFSPWWSLLPVGLFFVWGLLKANYEAFEAERKRAQVAEERAVAAEAKLASQASPLERARASIPRRLHFSMERDVAREAARAQQTIEQEHRVRALRRACIEVHHLAEGVRDRRESIESLNSVTKRLRIEQQDFGRKGLGDVYDMIDAYCRELGASLDASDDGSHWSQAADLHASIVGRLDDWLLHLHV